MHVTLNDLQLRNGHYFALLANCLIYARALLEYVFFIMWLRYVRQ